MHTHTYMYANKILEYTMNRILSPKNTMKFNRSLSRQYSVPVLPASCSDFGFQAELLTWVCPN